MQPDALPTLAPWIAAAAAALTAAGEWLHARRVHRIRELAFGPGARARSWTGAAPALRVAAVAGLVWALATLVAFDNRTRERERRAAPDRHLMVLLDVSPSMLLADAGEGGGETRTARAAAVLKSVLDRVPGDNVRFTAAGFYTEARLMVRECSDRELILHFAGGVPFHVAYLPGRTDLLKALNQAGEFMKDWPRKSATLLVLSDGDSVPPTGLKPMPSSVAEVLFAGVGDAGRGTFIDGHNSRQDAATLSQLSRRLGGKFFDCNTRQIPSDALRGLNAADPGAAKWRADRRWTALAVLGAAAATLCLLPLLLDFLGSAWRPGPAAARPPSRSNS